MSAGIFRERTFGEQTVQGNLQGNVCPVDGLGEILGGNVWGNFRGMCGGIAEGNVYRECLKELCTGKMCKEMCGELSKGNVYRECLGGNWPRRKCCRECVGELYRGISRGNVWITCRITVQVSMCSTLSRYINRNIIVSQVSEIQNVSSN